MHAGFAWAVSCIVAGCFSPTILRWLKAPADALVKAGRIEIVSLNITGGFSQIMSIALWGGTVISFPFVMYFALRFIFPALTKREKVAILFFLIAGTVFFGFGVGFAFGQLAPNVVSFFDLVNEWVGLSVTQVQVEDYVPLIHEARPRVRARLPDSADPLRAGVAGRHFVRHAPPLAQVRDRDCVLPGDGPHAAGSDEPDRDGPAALHSV